MNPVIVEGIINKISDLAINDDQTIPLEIIPTSFETEKFRVQSRWNIRASIGVQSLKKTTLKN